MPDHNTYDYAVIRVVPRVDREEFVNVGVIVSCPARKFLEAAIELDEKRVRVVQDVCKEGDEMLVKVIGIDRATGKIRLSRREALGKSPEVVHNFRAVAS